MSKTSDHAQRFQCRNPVSEADALRLQAQGFALTDLDFAAQLRCVLMGTLPTAAKPAAQPVDTRPNDKIEPAAPPPNIDLSPLPEVSAGDLDEGFLRAERYERFEAPEPVSKAEDWRYQATDFSANDLKEPLQDPPWLALMPKAMLQRHLRRFCRGYQPSAELDVPLMLRHVSHLHSLQHLPMRSQARTQSAYWVLWDQHPSLEALAPDRKLFRQQLQRLVGGARIHEFNSQAYPHCGIQSLPGGQRLPVAHLLEQIACQRSPWHVAYDPLLILSDLGQYLKRFYQRPELANSWLAFGQACARAGVRPLVFVPDDVRHIDSALARYFTLVPWCLASNAPRSTLTKHTQDAQQLGQAGHEVISLLVLVPHIYPSLLRQVCRTFYPHWGLSLERWVSAQTCFEPYAHFLCFKPEHVEGYRDGLKVSLCQHPEKLQSLMAILLQEFKYRSPVMRVHVLLNYLDFFQSHNIPHPYPDLAKDLVQYLRNLVQYLNQRDATPNNIHLQWVHYWSQTLMQSQAWREEAKALWAYQKNHAPQTPYPSRLEPQHMANYLKPQADTLYAALSWQQGHLTWQVLQESSQSAQLSTLVGVLPSLQADVVFRDDSPVQQQTLNFSETLSHNLPLNEQRRGHSSLLSQAAALHLSWVTKPSWAQQMAVDRYGLYADVEIMGVVQRFRWIPPGECLIGSPPSESGRKDYSENYEGDQSLAEINYDGERQFTAVISQGFWLADTTCTQALWEAVMGENPSECNGEQQPVDSVSWDQVQHFMQQVQQQVPQLQLRLPSEVQWEYACRAGTRSMFFFGEQLTHKQAHFSQEQFEDAKQTIAVKAKPANAWGLYQMHGNVWEWCQDKFGPYPEGVVLDYQAPSSLPDYRVLRGGSWGYSKPERLRSANRDFNTPGSRDINIGFRLSLV